MQFRRSLGTAALAAHVLAAPAALWASSAVDGGSGLVRVDRAYSLPVTGLLFSTYGILDTEDTAPDARFFGLTPSLTKGLGAGFEISGSLPLEGLSADLGSQDYSRRLDVRSRDPIANLRWTTPVGTSRLRLGAQGTFAWALFNDKTRPGGTTKPENAFDIGAKGMLSTEIGSWRFPLFLHVDGGWFWNRDDGAFYYRDLPAPLPFVAAPGQKNDVLTAGVALEGGFRRFAAFAELTTEQFLDARGEMRSRENLWRLTPGVRAKVSSTIAVTAAVSFDLSRDASETAFDPDAFYPDVELRAGLTLGQVLRRRPTLVSQRREEVEDEALAIELEAAAAAPPAPATPAPVATAQPAPQQSVAKAPAAAAATPTTAPEGESPPAAAAKAVVPAPQPAAKAPAAVAAPAATTPPAPMEADMEHRMQTFLERIDRVERDMQMQRLHKRLLELEKRYPPLESEAAAPDRR